MDLAWGRCFFTLLYFMPQLEGFILFIGTLILIKIEET